MFKIEIQGFSVTSYNFDRAGKVVQVMQEGNHVFQYPVEVVAKLSKCWWQSIRPKERQVST